MSPTRSKEMVMGHHHWSVSLTNKTFREIISWYERLGLDDRVSLTDETVKEFIRINVNENGDVDRLRQRLLENFYDGWPRDAGRPLYGGASYLQHEQIGRPDVSEYD